MPEAEGKSFSFEDHSSIREDYLEVIAYDGAAQEITYETEEFSAVCPFSGLPDISYVRILYVPEKKIVELKSLKYYFTSYRNVGIYQEAATNRIFHDLNSALEPRFLEIETVYNIRGGILSTCLLNSDTAKKYPRGRG